MVKFTRTALITVVVSILFMQMACAQGLKGAPSCLRRLAQTPPLLRGATDEQRWDIFLKSQKFLIGMPRNQVEALFGSGAESTTGKEVTFKLTDEKQPSKKGQLAYLELTLKFQGEKVSGYCVEAVDWG